MLTQDIWKKFTPSLWLKFTFQQCQKTWLSWDFLKIAQLNNFELVSDQFSGLGVFFDDAIAVRPSNPRFQDSEYRTVLMATNQGKSLKVSVSTRVIQTHLWIVGSQATFVSALNEQGHCVAVGKTLAARPGQTSSPYLEQSVIIDTSTAKSIRVDSKSPFVITQLAVKQCYPSKSNP